MPSPSPPLSLAISDARRLDAPPIAIRGHYMRARGPLAAGRREWAGPGALAQGRRRLAFLTWGVTRRKSSTPSSLSPPPPLLPPQHSSGRPLAAPARAADPDNEQDLWQLHEELLRQVR